MDDQSRPVDPKLHYVVMTVTSNGYLKLYLNPCELYVTLIMLIITNPTCVQIEHFKNKIVLRLLKLQLLLSKSILCVNRKSIFVPPVYKVWPVSACAYQYN